MQAFSYFFSQRLDISYFFRLLLRINNNNYGKNHHQRNIEREGDYYKRISRRYGGNPIRSVSIVGKSQPLNGFITGHHLKFALSEHSWNEPYKNIEAMRAEGLDVIDPKIGEVVELI